MVRGVPLNEQMAKRLHDYRRNLCQVIYTANKLKVGAIIVKDNRIISIGYNGTPSGWDNACEVIFPQHDIGFPAGITKPEVIHAEAYLMR